MNREPVPHVSNPATGGRSFSSPISKSAWRKELELVGLAGGQRVWPPAKPTWKSAPGALRMPDAIPRAARSKAKKFEQLTALWHAGHRALKAN
jgi:hypothetical protein